MSELDTNDPSWLSEAYDEKHREETVPLLFGEGRLNLQDPEQPAHPPSSSSFDAEPGYGSVDSKKPKPLQPPPDDGGKGPRALAAESSSRGVPSGSSAKHDGGTAPATPAEKDDQKAAAAKTTTKKKPQLTPRSAAALRAKPHVPSQNPCLWLFHLLQGIGVVAALMLWATQIIPLVLARGRIMATIGWASVLLKAYVSGFCAVFAAVESDLPVPFLLASNLLQRYFSRGLLYSFLGLVCLQAAYSERIRDAALRGGGAASALYDVTWAAIFMQLSAWLMVAVGVVYMLLGMCCMKRVRDRMKEREKQEWQEYWEALKEWKDLYQ